MFEKFGKVEVDWPRETARTMEMKKGENFFFFFF